MLLHIYLLLTLFVCFGPFDTDSLIQVSFKKKKKSKKQRHKMLSSPSRWHHVLSDKRPTAAVVISWGSNVSTLAL